MSKQRNLARLGAVTGTAALLTALAVAPSSAHVTVTASDSAAGASSVLTFSVAHGCEGSPTTGITMQVPEEILSVSPTVNPSWTVQKTMAKLDEPVADAHGNEVTERVSEVVYTAKQPLADGYRETFDLSLTLPDAEGTELAFPVVQTCQQGQTAWVETAAEGQDPEELERPAPTVTITAASGEGPDAAGAETAAEGDLGDSEESSSAEDGGDEASPVLGYASAGAAVVALLVALLALTKSRRKA